MVLLYRNVIVTKVSKGTVITLESNGSLLTLTLARNNVTLPGYREFTATACCVKGGGVEGGGGGVRDREGLHARFILIMEGRVRDVVHKYTAPWQPSGVKSKYPGVQVQHLSSSPLPTFA